MKIFNQLGIIFGIWAVGELISSLISNVITMPGTIIGMILLFILLKLNIMKEETIQDVADFLLGNMAIFFVPAGVSLINSLGLIQDNMMVLLLSGTIATIVIMIVTGKIVEIMINKDDASLENNDVETA
ncbi:CidA/LrgA family protein [Terrisporobacter sp.]